jgi:hypothetical protein
MCVVEKLFWLSVKFNFRLSASFVPGKCNILADRISRLSSPVEAGEAFAMLNISQNEPMYCFNNMSYDAFLSLQESWSRESRGC